MADAGQLNDYTRKVKTMTIAEKIQLLEELIETEKRIGTPEMVLAIQAYLANFLRQNGLG